MTSAPTPPAAESYSGSSTRRPHTEDASLRGAAGTEAGLCQLARLCESFLGAAGTVVRVLGRSGIGVNVRDRSNIQVNALHKSNIRVGILKRLDIRVGVFKKSGRSVSVLKNPTPELVSSFFLQ